MVCLVELKGSMNEPRPESEFDSQPSPSGGCSQDLQLHAPPGVLGEAENLSASRLDLFYELFGAELFDRGGWPVDVLSMPSGNEILQPLKPE